MMKQNGLTAFDLKLIAIIAMLIDHVGAIFFPELLFMRMIGRLTMPIMAFFIAQGYYHTKDVKKYVGRLLLASLVSSVPFGMLFGWSIAGNVMLTLALGVCAIYTQENVQDKLLRWLIIFVLYGISIFGDWQIIGIIMVQCFWRAHRANKKWDITIVITFSVLTLILAIFSISFYESLPQALMTTLAQGAACFLALPLLNLYNGKQGPKAKWIFYGFYPAHLWIILLVSQYLG